MGVLGGVVAAGLGGVVAAAEAAASAAALEAAAAAAGSLLPAGLTSTTCRVGIMSALAS